MKRSFSEVINILHVTRCNGLFSVLRLPLLSAAFSTVYQAFFFITFLSLCLHEPTHLWFSCYLSISSASSFFLWSESKHVSHLVCLTLGGPVDCSPPGSSVHGILQARMLEWVAMPSSRRTSWPRDGTASLSLLHWQVGSLPLAPPGIPAAMPTTA